MARDGAIDGHPRHMLSETVEPDQINPWTLQAGHWSTLLLSDKR